MVVVLLGLLLNSCSTPYSSFVGTHQDQPFEAQVNASFNDVWATIEKVFVDEKMPISWRDKGDGVIVSNRISFLRSHTYEDAAGELLDPSSRVVLSGDETAKPSLIEGKWRFHVQSKDEDVSILTIALQYPRALSFDNGTSTTRFVRSTGAFEKMIYGMILGKDSDKLEKPAPTPLLSEEKEEVVAAATEHKDKMQDDSIPMTKEVVATTTQQKKDLMEDEPAPLARKSRQIKSPEDKKSHETESMASNVESSMSDKKMNLPQESTGITVAEDHNELSASIADLKNQIATQDRIIKDQRKEIEELRTQKKTIAVAKQQSPTSYPKHQVNNHKSEGLTVQFIALSKSNRQFEDVSDLGELVVEKVPNKNVYRYKIGHFENKLDANRALVQLRNRGFSDAFIN